MTDSKVNPLLPRVLVNRVWHHLFGRGIVASVDNAMCSVGVTAVLEESRPVEDRGKCLSLELNQQLREENALIAATQFAAYGWRNEVQSLGLVKGDGI